MYCGYPYVQGVAYLAVGFSGAEHGEGHLFRIDWGFLSLHVVHPPVSALERVIVLRTYSMESVTLSM